MSRSNNNDNNNHNENGAVDDNVRSLSLSSTRRSSRSRTQRRSTTVELSLSGTAADDDNDIRSKSTSTAPAAPATARTNAVTPSPNTKTSKSSKTKKQQNPKQKQTKTLKRTSDNDDDDDDGREKKRRKVLRMSSNDDEDDEKQEQLQGENEDEVSMTTSAVVRRGRQQQPSSSKATTSKTRTRTKTSKNVSTKPAAPKTTAVSTNKPPSSSLNLLDMITSDMIERINVDQPFIDLDVPPSELRPSATLTTGQCFHWKAISSSKSTMVIDDTVLENDKEDEDDDSHQNGLKDTKTSSSLSKSSSLSASKSKSKSAWGTHDATEWIGTVRLPLSYTKLLLSSASSSSSHNGQNYEQQHGQQQQQLSVVLVIRETPTTTLYRPLTPLTLVPSQGQQRQQPNKETEQKLQANSTCSHVDLIDVFHDFLRHHYFQISPATTNSKNNNNKKKRKYDSNDVVSDAMTNNKSKKKNSNRTRTTNTKSSRTGAVREAEATTDLHSPTLQELYEEWSTACPRMKIIANCLPGVRIIQQDPWECLVSFICSSNNNIPRITQMVDKLRRQYGTPLLTIPMHNTDGSSSSSSPSSSSTPSTSDEGTTFYSFPSLDDMISATVTEGDLRSECLVGYRAKYIMGTIDLLREKGGEDYLRQLYDGCDGESIATGNDDDNDDPTVEKENDIKKEHERSIVLQEKLCEFPGVGRKVADCVALFSLRGENCIPVDTHVWNIAIRDYAGIQSASVTKTTKENDGEENDDKNKIVLSTTVKSITPAIYRAVGDLFRERFPTKSGWAHSLLFVAELPSFRPALPTSLIEEMDEFKKDEQIRKKEQKKKDKDKQAKSGKPSSKNAKKATAKRKP